MSDQTASASAKPGQFTVAVNIFTAPGEAFRQIQRHPTRLFPLILVLLPTVLAMFWYYQIVDFDWYVDDLLSQSGASESEQEEAREMMLSMSQTNFMWLGILGSSVGMVMVYLLQAVYLSLASALTGAELKFRHWFALACWAGLPYLTSVLGMLVNIALNSNGQLSPYNLDPLTLANLGIQTGNPGLQAVFSALNLPLLWTVALLTMAWRQWLDTSLVRALAVICTPYVIIFGTWTYFALS